MDLLNEPAPGGRVDPLTLLRLSAGELSASEADTVRERLSEADRAALAAIEATRAEVPPLDVAAVRKRALPNSLTSHAPVTPANRSAGFLSAILLAAGFGLAVVPALEADPLAPPGVRVKGGVDLQAYVLKDRVLVPHDGGSVAPDAVIGLRALGAGEAVLFGVDAAGTVQRLAPERGTLPLRGAEIEVPGSFALDGTPGTQAFVLVLDRTPEDAESALRAAFDIAGIAGVNAWSAAEPGVDLVVVEAR